MGSLVKCVHHITLCPAGAQEDLDFFTRVLGQRLVKQTVLMDGRIPVYHLYYGNADASVGSIATSFPYSRRIGRRGSGQVSATSYAVPQGATAFWAQHLDAAGVTRSGVLERFGRKYIRLAHPAGLLFEIMEEPGDARRPWTTPAIPADAATRGFFGAVLSVREVAEQESFLTQALGLCKVGVDGAFHRFEVPGGGPATAIDLLHEPDREPGSWGFGAGTAHHIAFNLETDEALVQQKALYEELGFTDASELKDRYYFHSMYVRSPGGILVECTSNVPGGFYQDEAPEDLGTKLHLPPWYEDQRAEILSALEPLVVPEGNRPHPGAATGDAVSAPMRARVTSCRGIRLSRTKAAFIADEG
jgi:glyoxalase family protein